MAPLRSDIAADAADTALIAATALFARWLDEHSGDLDSFEPDHTYAEVIAGCALCLLHAGVVGRLHGETRGALWHSINHLRSFALGGTPVVVGELWQWRQRVRARAAYQPPERNEE